MSSCVSSTASPARSRHGPNLPSPTTSCRRPESPLAKGTSRPTPRQATPRARALTDDRGQGRTHRDSQGAAHHAGPHRRRRAHARREAGHARHLLPSVSTRAEGRGRLSRPLPAPSPIARGAYPMNQETHEQQLRARFTGQFVERASSESQILARGHRQSRAQGGAGPATAPGRYQILFIHEGKANGFTFSRQVLQDSAPLWEGASVFVDHSLWGMPSVRDLGGVLSHAAWSQEFSGLTAELTLAGPSKEIIRDAAEITMRDGATPNIVAP